MANASTTSSAHTSAPWTTFRRIDKNSFKIGAPIPGDNNAYTSEELKATARHICDVEFADADKEEARANARLIATAPELLEFVKGFAGDCYENSGEYPEKGEDGKAPCLACQANDLIAKAEGN